MLRRALLLRALHTLLVSLALLRTLLILSLALLISLALLLHTVAVGRAFLVLLALGLHTVALLGLTCPCIGISSLLTVALFGCACTCISVSLFPAVRVSLALGLCTVT